ncbi:flagellar hook-length control protein FliK [Jeotgalibacillus haloalkalitolerans]|uniref:Flagellar hook-length control protein FliK n=1 Tax=Jeotgalibacillus haloalkalitolerans TaxID=3104292 RepID=A0ABU5KKF5_9BACL|nr:flagellar hook-length control protein FliK [Jeotgalibacillus sp. HH7-29]MDZ5711723.1 flagellar hook-length control protein FliK [Jeotgalibacillus sp. HH7-29]
MIGQITVQTVQAPQQLGSEKMKINNSNELFSTLLFNAGGETLQTNDREMSDLDMLLEQLMAALETEDLPSFIKAADEAVPEIKQMFMMFDEKELMDLTLAELLLAAGVSEELVEKAASAEMTDPEQLLTGILTSDGGEQSEEEHTFSLLNLQVLNHQIVLQNEGLQTDPQNSKLPAVQEDLAKLVLLIKGLSLIDPKKTAASEKSNFIQNMTEVMESIEKVFKSAVRDIEAPIKQEGFKQSISPEVLKTDQGMLNLQTLQLQSGPVKWSLNQSFRQPDSAQQLMEQFQNIMQKAKFGKVNGTEKLMIRLQPEHLGTLKIELLQKDGMLTARIIASSAVAKEMIDSQLNQLRQSFTAQNLQVEKVEISQAQTAESRLDKERDQNHQHRDRENQQQNEREHEDEQLSFHDIFLNIEV